MKSYNFALFTDFLWLFLSGQNVIFEDFGFFREFFFKAKGKFENQVCISQSKVSKSFDLVPKHSYHVSTCIQLELVFNVIVFVV